MSNKPRFWYLPLEPYEERYTKQLLDWMKTTMFPYIADYFSDLIVVTPPPRPQARITSGGVLNPSARVAWAFGQVEALIREIESGRLVSGDTVLLADFFHPGIESLLYVADQRGVRVRLFSQMHAQSVDVYDFVAPMRRWMRPYEQMMAAASTGVLISSPMLAEMWRVSGLHDVCPGYPCGLILDPCEIESRVDRSKVIPRPRSVAWSSRFDPEKKPEFLVEVARALLPYGIRIEVLSGGPAATRDPSSAVAVADLKSLASAGLLDLRTDLSKNDYYTLLAGCGAHLNTALQDWVSYAMLDAASLGVPSVVPCFRSFPDATAPSQDMTRLMYRPWSVEHCVEQIKAAIDLGGRSDVRRVAEYHDGTGKRWAEVVCQC